jgi:hypothetical protein
MFLEFDLVFLHNFLDFFYFFNFKFKFKKLTIFKFGPSRPRRILAIFEKNGQHF